MKSTIMKRWRNITKTIDSIDMNEPEREMLKHDVDCEFQLGIEELQQLDVFKWLEENHPLGKQCFTKEARLIETIIKFRDEILAEIKSKYDYWTLRARRGQTKMPKCDNNPKFDCAVNEEGRNRTCRKDGLCAISRW